MDTFRAATCRGALVLAACCTLALIAGCAALHGQNSPAVVKVRTIPPASTAHPGSALSLTIAAEIAPGFHINDHHPSLEYLIPTNVTFKPAAGFKLAGITYPKGKPIKFSFMDSPISVYQGKIRIGVQVHISREVHPGSYALRGKLDYQACNDHACLAPTSVPLDATIRVAR